LSEGPAAPEESIFVLLDSNAWISAGFLRSFQGANLVSFLFRTKNKLILPEIVEREFTRLYEIEIRSNVDRATSALRRIGFLTGVATKFVPPKPEIASQAVDRLLLELAPVLERPKFTFRHAVFALDMILAKQSPCGPENEQFRDCCVWMDCVEYGKQRKTLFVSADKAFYKDRKYENGLAENLSNDLVRLSSTVHTFPDRTDLYKTLEPAVSQDETETVSTHILSSLGSEIVSAIAKHGFTKAMKGPYRVSLRPAGQPTQRFVSFEFDFSLEGPPGDTERLDPVLTCSGSCAYNVASGDISDVNLDSTSISWTGIDGKRIKSTTHYVGVTESLSASTAINFIS
jgi:hypothetical protein